MSKSQMVALVALLGLLLLGTLGLALWVVPQQIPRSLPMALYCIPLLLPLRGMLHGRPRSYIWAGFLSFAYFALGIDLAINRIADERLFGILTLVLSLILWSASILFIRQSNASQPTDSSSE